MNLSLKLIACFALSLAPALTFAEPAATPLVPQVQGAVFMHHKLEIETKSGKHPIDVEVAMSYKEQEQGLMFRKIVPDNTGMIFLFPHKREIDMWMKNTLVSLDMIFMDDHGIVTHIVENALPESTDIITSGGEARAVLELGAGSAKKLLIAKGDKVIYAYFHE